MTYLFTPAQRRSIKHGDSFAMPIKGDTLTQAVESNFALIDQFALFGNVAGYHLTSVTISAPRKAGSLGYICDLDVTALGHRLAHKQADPAPIQTRVYLRQPDGGKDALPQTKTTLSLR